MPQSNNADPLHLKKRKRMKPRKMTKLDSRLATGLLCQLFCLGAHAHGLSVVRYNGGDASQCVSIFTVQHFGPVPQYYFRSACEQKVRMKVCFQVSNKGDTSPYNCNIR